MTQRVYNNLLGDAVLGSVTTPVVAFFTSALRTVAGDAAGFADRCSAAASATSGEAIDVPLMLWVAVLLVYQAERIALPAPRCPDRCRRWRTSTARRCWSWSPP